MASQRDLSGRRRFGSGAVSFVGRHPVGSYLVLAFVIFWASWMPVLFFGAPPRPFSATGAILGLALPAVLVTAATDGRAGVRDLLHRVLRWRVGIGWYLLAMLAVPVGALLLAPLFLGSAALEGLPQNWPLLFTEFVPQLLLALVTVQVFEELGWAGFAQHRLQTRHGALKASLLVALAFAGLHLPTYLSAPISGESVIQDLSVMVIVIPFAIFFRILITFAYNRTRFSVLIAAISHASFNEASEIISKRARALGSSSGIRISRTIGTTRRGDQQRHLGLQPRSRPGCAPGHYLKCPSVAPQSCS